ncbi:unnamed protein product [Citrullus colocynthis]|uniref:Uncharacterized protein n=1 Tax=Citrullus colocynthis TaxID=252529 RepID=A0ABP0Z0S0_9ROSI
MSGILEITSDFQIKPFLPIRLLQSVRQISLLFWISTAAAVAAVCFLSDISPRFGNGDWNRTASTLAERGRHSDDVDRRGSSRH